MNESTENRTRQAVRKRQEALIEQKIADGHEVLGDVVGSSIYGISAESMSREADDLTELESSPQIVAGEVVPTTADRKGFVMNDTLRSPDSAAVDASIARTDLLLQDNADITALAVDAANSIGADNSLEKMLAHQLAAAHDASMRLMNSAVGVTQEVAGNTHPAFQEEGAAHAAKLYNSAARLMNTFQQGLLALNKIRNGGRQTVTVQHVNVSDGGQAVIGNVQGGGESSTGPDHKGGNTP